LLCIQAIRTSRNSSHERIRLTTRLTEFQRILQEVDTSGHCQFDAIGKKVGKHYTDVRQDVGGWLRKHPNFEFENNAKIRDFLQDIEWPTFCDEVSLSNASNPRWGCHLTLFAAAQFYRRTIRVWSSRPGNEYWLEIMPHGQEVACDEPIEIAHEFERHYLSVELYQT